MGAPVSEFFSAVRILFTTFPIYLHYIINFSLNRQAADWHQAALSARIPLLRSEIFWI